MRKSARARRAELGVFQGSEGRHRVGGFQGRLETRPLHLCCLAAWRLLCLFSFCVPLSLCLHNKGSTDLLTSHSHAFYISHTRTQGQVCLASQRLRSNCCPALASFFLRLTAAASADRHATKHEHRYAAARATYFTTSSSSSSCPEAA